MRGNEKIIAHLNEVLKAELTAINQYFLHAEMCENWGYEKLANYGRKESIDEMRHAEKCMERILFLDGAPTRLNCSRSPSARTSGNNCRVTWTSNSQRLRA